MLVCFLEIYSKRVGWEIGIFELGWWTRVVFFWKVEGTEFEENGRRVFHFLSKINLSKNYVLMIGEFRFL